MRSLRCRHQPFSSIDRPASRKIALAKAVKVSRTFGHIAVRPSAAASLLLLRAVSSAAPAVLSAKDDSDPPRNVGPQGPKLPPRPVKPKASKDGKKAGGDSGGDGGGGGPGPSGTRALAALAAHTLLGTAAIVLANLAGIDLWESFRWSSWEDLRLALIASIPLQLLNAAILLPSYGSQRLPDLGDLKAFEERLQEEQRKQEAAHRAQQAPQVPQEASQPAQAHGNGTAVAAAAAAGGAGGAHVPEGSLAGDAAAGGLAAGGGPAPPRASGPPEGVLPAACWGGGSQPADGSGVESSSSGRESGSSSRESGSSGSSRGGSKSGSAGGGGGGGGPGGLQGVGSDEREGDQWWGWRGALHLAQGYYISNNPTAKLTPRVEALMAVVDTAAGEMLYRGVALTWLAAWLEDRVYEAGLGDSISELMPSAAALDVHSSCEWAVAAITASFVLWYVVYKSKRAARTVEQLVGNALAARKGNKKDAAGQAGESKTSNGNTSGTSNRPSTGPLGSGGEAPPGPSTTTSTTTSSNSSSSTKPPASGSARVLIGGPGGAQEVGFAGSVANTMGVLQRAGAVQAVRDAVQVLIINGIFVASGGNLAASFAAALTNQLIISALQRRGVQRMRERSAALAKELKAYNAEVQRIKRKYKSKLPLPPATATAAEGTAAEDGPTASISTPPGSTAADSALAAAESSSGGNPEATAQGTHTLAAVQQEAPVSTHEGKSVIDPDATGSPGLAPHSPGCVLASGKVTAAAEGPGSGSSSAHGSSNNETSGKDSTCSSTHTSSLDRALAMLEQLVPEQPKTGA
ncbi:hypothetical protein Agub_g14869 [Astrephomene gubernaculifera]|uniref:Uncharacterized protein n=1 Tax=Astrephomene gubernaculifera TaxID=47775 RepID=A0AAD3E480_9CHLO|nr:hypothetical protein Agub_g14869 [Astrephomene gubernaculifera]